MPPSPVRRKPKLGEILRDAFPALWQVAWLDRHRKRVLYRLSRCGTGELGSMEFTCDDCGHVEWRPLGCQDRHCPSCGVRKAEDWAQARVAELIDAPYFHLVFTVPGELYGLFRANQSSLYNLFFSKVNETLKAFSANPKHLGGTPAFFCVLHTTNRQLGYHPHVHVVMAGAAFDEAKGKLALVPKDDFLFPVRALAASFRGRFLTGFRKLVDTGKVKWTGGGTTAPPTGRALEARLSELFAKSWQVRTDAATGGPELVIRYLARYTHRSAISNARIVRYEDGAVTYTWQDRKTRRRRSETLPLLDFVRRFSQHILPKGFKRVRCYGLLSPSKRGTVLVKAQAAARHAAKLRGIARAVACPLGPERLPKQRCAACGSENVRATGVLRGSTLVRLRPDAYAQAPPPGMSAPDGETA